MESPSIEVEFISDQLVTSLIVDEIPQSTYESMKIKLKQHI